MDWQWRAAPARPFDGAQDERPHTGDGFRLWAAGMMVMQRSRLGGASTWRGEWARVRGGQLPPARPFDGAQDERHLQGWVPARGPE